MRSNQRTARSDGGTSASCGPGDRLGLGAQVYGESDFPVVQGRVIGVLRWLAN
jgi:hypothetical protein